MAITDEGSGNGFYMPVAPAYAGNGNSGFGFGGDWAWILLLLVLFGGWNNNGYGGGFGGGDLYPWMNNSQHISDGFRDQMLNTTITSISDKLTSGFGDVQNALCAGFNQAEISANARQMADMQQMFSLQSSLQQCCCENRAATADLKYTIATEECATRQASADNTRAILDKLCQLELDGKDQRIADLERQLTMANLAASQSNQTSRILADNAAQTSALEQYLAPIPRPAYIVQNPACCNQQVGCGCGSF